MEISERPVEADDRSVPGHWDRSSAAAGAPAWGDLLLGKGGRSQVGVIVERTSRLVQLIALPEDRKAVTVKDAIAGKITELPEALLRSLTWDRGKEMTGPAVFAGPAHTVARHADFTVETGVQVYFCDPHSPWQRGTDASAAEGARGTAEHTTGERCQLIPLA